MAELAQCGRCRAFTLLDKTGPVAVAVDFMPLGAVGYVAALSKGGDLYGVLKRQSGAMAVRLVARGVVIPAWGSTGLQEGAERLHVEHGCPASVQRVVKATNPKDSAPVTPGAPKAGSRPLAAHVYAERGPATRSPATTATHHLSRAYPVCGTCQRNIPNGKLFTGVQHGPVWIWAECENCE